METFMKLLETIQTFVWGPPTLVLLMGTGLYFTYKLRGIQICKFPRALKSIFEKEEGAGDVSPFATLCTTLAADIGTGSIVGVATALRIGGPGAMFWMWVSALLGMTTKYAEALLAVKFRVKDEKGEIAGGPMYYIQNGMGDKFKWLAKIFAFFGVVTALLGCGTFPQVNAITESVHDSFHIPVIVIGIIVTVLTAVVTLGGIQAISKVAQFVVPFMAISFIGGSMVILIVNHSAIPGAFAEIFSCAFSKESALGGAAGTAVISFMTAMRTGVARGVYTNEAGLGSSPIVAAAAKTDSCVKQGLISMTATFWDTVVLCAVTGIVVVIYQAKHAIAKSGMASGLLVKEAFAELPLGGTEIIGVATVAFAVATLIGWSLFGKVAAEFLGGKQLTRTYQYIYVIMIFAGAVMPLGFVW